MLCFCCAEFGTWTVDIHILVRSRSNHFLLHTVDMHTLLHCIVQICCTFSLFGLKHIRSCCFFCAFLFEFRQSDVGSFVRFCAVDLFLSSFITSYCLRWFIFFSVWCVLFPHRIMPIAVAVVLCFHSDRNCFVVAVVAVSFEMFVLTASDSCTLTWTGLIVVAGLLFRDVDRFDVLELL